MDAAQGWPASTPLWQRTSTLKIASNASLAKGKAMVEAIAMSAPLLR
jgi:hypothetical protein